jgi:predicted permease
LNTIEFLQPFLVLFGLIALGSFIAYLQILDAHAVRQISRLVVDVTLPAAILVAVITELTMDMLRAAPLMVLSGVALGLTAYALGLGVARFTNQPPPRRGVMAFACGCSNTGFLGIPLVGAVFGPAAAVLAVLVDFATTINIFTFGVAGLDRSAAHVAPHADAPRNDTPRIDVRRLIINLLNPMFLALVLAVGWSALGWGLPSPVAALLGAVGDTTTPLAMIVLGHMLYSARDRVQAAARHVGPVALIRLLIAPTLMIAAIYLVPGIVLQLSPEARAVIVLQAAMPTAMLTPVLAQQYDADVPYGVSAAVLTTLIAMITLPLTALGIRHFLIG